MVCIKCSLKRFWWIIFEIAIALFISLIIAPLLAQYIRADIDWTQIYARLGSDALTLTGFVITSLAIIAKQIDNPAFDEVRDDRGFNDLWPTFAGTALVFLVVALSIRLVEIFEFPISYVSDIVFALIRFLIMLGILLLFTCILLLSAVISLINENRVEKLQNEVETPRNMGN